MRALHAHAIVLAYALLATAPALQAADATATCRFNFSGDAFLQAASQHGLNPQYDSDCIEVSVSDNRFYATPLAACELSFGNAAWLSADASFQKVEGQGSFTAHVDSSGLQIKIRPGGGFYLKSVTITVKGAPSSCTGVSLEDVLGTG